jgi:hypothetical protein
MARRCRTAWAADGAAADAAAILVAKIMLLREVPSRIPNQVKLTWPQVCSLLKMKLTAAQTEELTFPVGCLVWYNFLPEHRV